MQKEQQADINDLSEEEKVILEDVKKRSKRDKMLDNLLPKSGALVDFQFGSPERQKEESLEEYRFRLKVEERMLLMRKHQGVAQWDSKTKGKLTLEKTQQKKYLKKNCTTKKQYKEMKKIFKQQNKSTETI